MDIKSEYKSLIKADKRLSDLVRLGNLPAPIRHVSEVLAHSGDPKFMAPLLILAWILGDVFWKQWAVTMVLGLALLALVIWPLKRLVSRKRPIGLWARKTRDQDPHSFPSGHASRSFFVAVLATALGPAWLAIPLWVWAPLVALSRVAMGVHYLSDIIGGLVLAFIVGLLWLHVHEGVLQAILWFSLQVLHVPLW